MEFNQDATKAALHLSDHLRKMIDESNNLARSFFKDSKKIQDLYNGEGVNPEISEKNVLGIMHSLQAALFQDALDDLREQIEHQNFNY